MARVDGGRFLRRIEIAVPRVFGISCLWAGAPCGMIRWRRRISRERCEKGKPAARRGRKATGLEEQREVALEAAGLPNSGGVSYRTPPDTGGKRRDALRPHTDTVASSAAVCAGRTRRVSASTPFTHPGYGVCCGEPMARAEHPFASKRGRFASLRSQPGEGSTGRVAAGP